MNKGVFRAIVYYDCLDYPLDSQELTFFSFMDNGEVKAENLIEVSEKFYFLKGRETMIKRRRERNKIAEKKWEKMTRAAWWLKMVPYIRLIFTSGSLALRNTTKESDLDLLIIVKHGHIWLTRFLTLVLLDLLGVRRKRGQLTAPDKICVNHFITDKSLYIPRKSIYTAQLYARLVPILADEDSLLDKFLKANSWVGEYVRGWPTIKNSKSEILNSKQFQISKSKIQSFIKRLGEKILDTKFGNLIEKVLRKYQLRRIKNYPLTYKPGGRIVADDESLEFHPDSPELRIIERYNKKMIELGFAELAIEKDSGLRP